MQVGYGSCRVILRRGQTLRLCFTCLLCRKNLFDIASEQAVQDALDTLLKTNSHMTTVIVAHRLRTVRNADMIAFVENGHVAEIGTHQKLLQLPEGHYRGMVERAGNDGLLPES